MNGFGWWHLVIASAVAAFTVAVLRGPEVQGGSKEEWLLIQETAAGNESKALVVSGNREVNESTTATLALFFIHFDYALQFLEDYSFREEFMPRDLRLVTKTGLQLESHKPAAKAAMVVGSRRWQLPVDATFLVTQYRAKVDKTPDWSSATHYTISATSGTILVIQEVRGGFVPHEFPPVDLMPWADDSEGGA